VFGVLSALAALGISLVVLLGSTPVADGKPVTPIVTLSAPFGSIANRYLQNRSDHTNCGAGTWANETAPGSFALRTGRGGGTVAASLVGCNASSHADSWLWLGLQQLQFSVAKTGVYNITVHWVVSYSTHLSIAPNGSGAKAFAWSLLGVYSQWRDLTDGHHGPSLDYQQRANSYQLTNNGTLNQTVWNETILDTFHNAHLVGGDLDQMFAFAEAQVGCSDDASQDHLSASLDLSSPGLGLTLESVTVTAK
jgi:hypothetical protein